MNPFRWADVRVVVDETEQSHFDVYTRQLRNGAWAGEEIAIYEDNQYRWRSQWERRTRGWRKAPMTPPR